MQQRGYRGEGREMYIVIMKKEGLFYKSSDPFTFPYGDWNHIIPPPFFLERNEDLYTLLCFSS